MESVRQTWAIHQTYRKVQKLWLEYRRLMVAQDSCAYAPEWYWYPCFSGNGGWYTRKSREGWNLAVTSAFLRRVVAYQEWTVAVGPASSAKQEFLQAASIPGLEPEPNWKFTDILVHLLSTLDRQFTAVKPASSSDRERFTKLTDKVLLVAELVLKDDACRQSLAQTPLFLNQLMEAFEQLHGTETKRLALRLIATLGAMPKLPYRHSAGFKTMLDLLSTTDNNQQQQQQLDPELTAELLRTIRTLLVEGNGDETVEASTESAIASKSPMAGRIHTLIVEVQQFVVTEVSKAFPQIVEPSAPQTMIDPGTDMEPFTRLSACFESSIPSPEQILDLLKRMEDPIISPTPSIPPSPNLNLSRATAEAVESTVKVNEDSLGDWLHGQGVLPALVKILRNSTGLSLTARMDTLRTVCKLLLQNESAQKEFLEIDGYSAFLVMLDESECLQQDAPVQLSYRKFVELTLHCMGSLAVDGDANHFVQNQHALRAIFTVAAKSRGWETRLQALVCIQDVLSVNTANAVVIWKHRLMDTLMDVLSWESKHYTAAQHESSEQLFTHSVLITPGSHYESIVQTVNVLNYLSILLSSHNQYILLEYTRLLMELHWPVYTSNNQVVVLLLRSVARLLEDLVAKRNEAFSTLDHDKFLNIYLQLLRRIFHMETSADTQALGSHGATVNEPTHETKSTDSYNHLVRDQYLLLLKIVAHLVEASDRDMERFDALFGWDVLEAAALHVCHPKQNSLVCTEASPLDVVDMSFWMWKEYTLTRIHASLHDRCKTCASSCTQLRPGPSLERTYSLTSPQTKDTAKVEVEDRPSEMGRCLRLLSAITHIRVIDALDCAADKGMPSMRDSGFRSISQPSEPTPTDPCVTSLKSSSPYFWDVAVKILQLFSLLFRHDNVQEADRIRQLFANGEGVEKLLSLLQTCRSSSRPSPPSNFQTKILSTLCDFVNGSETGKTYILKTMGFDRFFQHLVDAQVIKDRLCWELLVLASVVSPNKPFHNLYKLFRTKNICVEDLEAADQAGVETSTVTSGDSQPVLPVYNFSDREPIAPEIVSIFMHDVLSPRVLMQKAIPLTAGFKAGFKNFPAFNSLECEVAGECTSTTAHTQKPFAAAPTSACSTVNTNRMGQEASKPDPERQTTKSVPTASKALRPFTSLSNSIHSGLRMIAPVSPEYHRGIDYGLPAHISEILPFRITSPRMSQRSDHSIRSANTKDPIRQSLRQNAAKNHVTYHLDLLQPKHLAGVVFRDVRCVAVLVKLLARVDLEGCLAHKEFVAFLVELLDANTRNRQLFSDFEEVSAVLWTLLHKMEVPAKPFDGDPSLQGSRKLLQDLLLQIYRHRISTKHVHFLFNMVCNPNSCAKPFKVDDEKSMELDLTETLISASGHAKHSKISAQALDIISKLSSWKEPRFQFSLDGVGGYYTSAPLDRFPASKYGFTLSCWIKPTHFSATETGFFCLQEPSTLANTAGVENCFELYFSKIQSAGNRFPVCPRRSGISGSGVQPTFYAYNQYSPPRNPHSSVRICLAVRNRHPLVPTEDFVFDEFDFGKRTGQWTHIVFIHHQQELKLFVNGSAVQSCSGFTYPKVSSNKEKALVAVLGKKMLDVSESLPRMEKVEKLGVPARTSWFGFWSSAGEEKGGKGLETQAFEGSAEIRRRCDRGYFYGSMSAAEVTEGSLSVQAIEKLYHACTTTRKKLKQTTADNRPVYILHPLNARHAEENCQGMLKRSVSEPNLPSGRPAVPSSLSLQMPDTPAVDYDEDQSSAITLAPGCDSNYIISLRDVMSEIGEFLLCFRVIALGSEKHVPGLRILESLLRHDEEKQKAFDAQDGWKIMTSLLLMHPYDITTGTMDAVFSLLHEDCSKKHIDRPQVLLLAYDLILAGSDAVQTHGMRLLMDLLYRVPETIDVWREYYGLEYLFEVLCNSKRAVQTLGFHLLDHILDTLGCTEIGRLLDFVAHDKKAQQDVKSEVVEILVRHGSYNPHVVDVLQSLGGIQLLISYLDAPEKRIRLGMLKLIGLLMSVNVKLTRPIMVKSSLFEGMCLLLASYPITSDTCTTLFGLALNWYVCDPRNDKRCKKPQLSYADILHRRYGEDRSKHVPVFSVGNLADPLQYPEMLRVILELLQGFENTEFVATVLSDFRRMLTPENLGAIWECTWTEWFISFLSDMTAGRNPLKDKVRQSAYAIIQKLVVFDIQRKQSAIGRAKGCVSEDDQFQTIAVETTLQYFQLDPTLSASNSKQVLCNLMNMYRYMEENILFDPMTYTHFAVCMNQLACHNNASIRTTMKTMGLFDIRDDIILRMLRADVASVDMQRFLRCFSFEHVADQPKFQENHGLLLLLRLFHRTVADPRLQLQIGEMIAGTFLPVEENRRVIGKILEDGEVQRRLFAVDAPSLRENPEMEQVQFALPTMDSFLGWYYSSQPDIKLRRNAIEQRIEAQCVSLLSSHQRLQARVMMRRNKRLSTVKDRQLRHALQSNRVLVDFKSKCSMHIQHGATMHQDRQDALRRSRYDRRRLGQEQFRHMGNIEK